MESKIVKRNYFINKTAQTIKLYQIRAKAMAFYTMSCSHKYYVKGTSLRLARNMKLNDINAKNHNGWVGCDTRNKAKRLIADNRQIIKIQKIVNCAVECFIQAVNSVEIKTSNDDKEEK